MVNSHKDRVGTAITKLGCKAGNDFIAARVIDDSILIPQQGSGLGLNKPTQTTRYHVLEPIQQGRIAAKSGLLEVIVVIRITQIVTKRLREISTEQDVYRIADIVSL